MTTESTTIAASAAWTFSNDESTAVLSDGSSVEFREITAADEDAIRGLYASLTPESIYLRFFSNATSSIEPEIARLTRTAPASHGALLALQDGTLVAVGCYEVLADPLKAEIAMVMGEHHHRLGLGSALVSRLATVASARGIERFVVEVLNHGDFMVDVIHHLGLPTHLITADLGSLEYELELAVPRKASV